MKVCVFDPKDPTIPVGIGDLCRYEDIRVVDDEHGDRELFTLTNHPVIVMENGDIMYGIECWWCPV